jgi:hypothetical protein
VSHFATSARTCSGRSSQGTAAIKKRGGGGGTQRDRTQAPAAVVTSPTPNSGCGLPPPALSPAVRSSATSSPSTSTVTVVPLLFALEQVTPKCTHRAGRNETAATRLATEVVATIRLKSEGSM